MLILKAKNLDNKIKEFWPKSGPQNPRNRKIYKKIFKRKNCY